MIRRAGNIKMALQSMRSAKWRSFLTMLGVIVGVLSVVTTVSLGEGIKQQITNVNKDRGQDLITIMSGSRVERDDSGKITEVLPVFNVGANLSDLDYKNIAASDQIAQTAPLARITGETKSDFASYQPTVIATSRDLPKLLNQSIAYGGFFTDSRNDEDSAVIGTRVAEQLFGENVPMGKSFEFRDKTFIVRGIFDDFPRGGLLPFQDDYNNTVFIPYDTGRELAPSSLPIDQILARPKDGIPVSQATSSLRARLLAAHSNQEDFTVLTQDELLLVAGRLLNLLTTFIAAVASISIIVGGIGIMNIMFVLVTERTREIGVRKAVGATTRQIMNQFLTEALIVSLLGGFMGIILSLLTNFLFRVFTDLQPVITLPIIGFAILISALVGVIFGATPAIKAARQDPIDSLRYE